jgi:hypothetical protein
LWRKTIIQVRDLCTRIIEEKSPDTFAEIISKLDIALDEREVSLRTEAQASVIAEHKEERNCSSE